MSFKFLPVSSGLFRFIGFIIASMHSAAAVVADDRSVQREDTLGMIYILLRVFLCFNALHGCKFLLSQYRQIAAISYIALILNNSLYARPVPISLARHILNVFCGQHFGDSFQRLAAEILLGNLSDGVGFSFVDGYDAAA